MKGNQAKVIVTFVVNVAVKSDGDLYSALGIQPQRFSPIYLNCPCIFQSTSLAEPISPNCVSSVANVTDCEAAINHVQKANKVSIASFAVCIALSLVIFV